MPKGWKPKPTEAERLAAIRTETTRQIRAYMALREIRYDMDLAAMIGMSRNTLSYKFKNSSWSQQDLCKIIKVLKIPLEDAAAMLGLKGTPS